MINPQLLILVILPVQPVECIPPPPGPGLMLTASIICTADSGCQLIPCSDNGGGEEISCCIEIVQKVKEGLCCKEGFISTSDIDRLQKYDSVQSHRL